MELVQSFKFAIICLYVLALILEVIENLLIKEKAFPYSFSDNLLNKLKNTRIRMNFSKVIGLILAVNTVFCSYVFVTADSKSTKYLYGGLLLMTISNTLYHLSLAREQKKYLKICNEEYELILNELYDDESFEELL